MITKQVKGNKHKVFIVDDHPIVRQGISQLINQEIDLVVCGDSGDVSNVRASIEQSTPNVVMVDISLGQSSGISLIEELSYYYPDLLILAFSMHDESIYAERCLKAGAKGYVMKQELPEKVMSALRKVLQGEIYLSEKIGTKLLYKLVTKKTDVSSSPFDKLSNRELEVFRMIGQGMKTREIAGQLNISIKTVESYMNHIKVKMNFKDARDLFKNAVQWMMNENAC